MKHTKIPSISNSLPHYLLANRSVKHFYIEPLEASVTAYKGTSSVGHQMECSIRDIFNELSEQGKDYEYIFKGGAWGDDCNRWHLYVNGTHFAVIDADFGYDCFDVSATAFKEKITALLEQSDIAPLSALERELIDARLLANRVLECIDDC